MSLSPMELYHEADKFLNAAGQGDWKKELDKLIENPEHRAPDIKRFVAMVRGRAAIRGWI